MDIFQMSFTGAIFIIAVVIVRVLTLHKLPKKVFLALWGVVICRLLVPFSIPFRFSFYTGIDMIKRMLAKRTVVSSPGGMWSIPNIENGVSTGEPIGIGLSAVSASAIEIVWLAGMCACALFFTVTYIKCRREFKMSLPVENDFIALWLREHPLLRPVQIRQSDKINAPLTYGIFRPVVLLPKKTDWTDETKLRYILSHEFVHIRHFDTLTKLVLTSAVCIHWFNPLVWVMYMLANRDIELSCDETVVRTFGEVMKSAYAMMLIDLEEKKSRLTPLCNNFSKNAIEERIVSIMKLKKISLMGIILALTLVIVTTTVFATNADSTAVSQAQTAYVATAEEDNSQTARNTFTEQELLAKYGTYGISFDENGKMRFNGEFVRYFRDGAELNSNMSSVYYEYLNEDGTVDVHTIRNVIDNGDGSVNPFGKLTEIVRYSQEEFEQRNLSDLKGSSNSVTYIAEGVSVEQGEPFVARFSKYKEYGIEYKEREESGIGNVYYHGQLVKKFIDENKDGGIFTYQSVDGGEIIVHTIYDEKGKLIGVEKGSN
ncbi:MAG: M56 family metallopeptidase [Firmicutes bacterium]|nr:M56 family metallopeptidase [Bacillota bacterium]